MTDRPNGEKSIFADYTAITLDELSAEELIRLTRNFIRRVTNEDRQRIALQIRASGHHRVLRNAPATLQRFIAGETDLDEELAQRYVHTPLLSHVRFLPTPGEPVRRQTTAFFSSQDDSALMTVSAPVGGKNGAVVEFTFTLMSMVGLAFRVDPLTADERLRWLELVRRENGITVLWTRDRWEKPYLIFVVREGFARVYAFAPAGFEAAARLTPDMLSALTGWLETVWFSRQEAVEAPSEQPTLLKRPDAPPPDESDAPPDTFTW